MEDTDLDVLLLEGQVPSIEDLLGVPSGPSDPQSPLGQERKELMLCTPVQELMWYTRCKDESLVLPEVMMLEEPVTSPGVGKLPGVLDDQWHKLVEEPGSIAEGIPQLEWKAGMQRLRAIIEKGGMVFRDWEGSALSIPPPEAHRGPQPACPTWCIPEGIQKVPRRQGLHES